MFCPNCGKSNLQQAKFCKYCGARLSCYDEQNNKDNTADLPPQPRIYQDNINLPPQHRQPDNRAGFGYDHILTTDTIRILLQKKANPQMLNKMFLEELNK